MKTPRAGLYHRVSTRDQDPTLARAELRQAAAARGYEVALDLEETGSGRRNDRPGLQEIMAAVRRHELQAVLVWKLDRFGRSVVDLLGNLDELRRSGVRFIATSQGIEQGDRADPTGGLLIRILACVAEFERDMISERTHLGLAGARRRGVRLGRPLADVDPARVAALRQELDGSGRPKSWRAIAEALGCSHVTAQRCYKRGTPAGAPGSDETEGPKSPGP